MLGPMDPDEETDIPQTLDEITDELVDSYNTFKDAEKEKDKDRLKFFKACDVEVQGDLARMTIEIPEGDSEPLDIEEFVKVFHPGWRLVEGRAATAVIEEDPSSKPYVHINRKLGMVIKREVSQGGPSLDDERLKREDPDLWKRISKPTRVLKSTDKISDKDIGAMSEYLVPGKMTAKLAAPRKAKPDELDA